MGADEPVATRRPAPCGAMWKSRPTHLRRARRSEPDLRRAPYLGIGKLYHFFTFSLPNSFF